MWQVYWGIVDVPTTTSTSAGVEPELLCFSYEQAAVAHPGDVTSWSCEEHSLPYLLLLWLTLSLSVL